MHFGKFNYELSSLKIQDLEYDFEAAVTHIWGPNGVGKSTLMQLMLDQLQRQNTKFGYINQNYRSSWLWWYDVRKNLELAARASGRKFNSLKDLPEIKRQSKWLDPLLSKTLDVDFSRQAELESSGLSGGQLQRLILLREVLHQPKILLLDEAFSALDKNLVPELAEWLVYERSLADFQIISIAHNEQLLRTMGGQVCNVERSPENNKLLILNMFPVADFLNNQENN
ncbi:MAG: hypothetical protein OHK0017_13090 [Patescibacteria group bacterium]